MACTLQEWESPFSYEIHLSEGKSLQEKELKENKERVEPHSLWTRWLRRSCVTCSCQALRVPVAEMGAAVGRFPMEPAAEPSDSS